MSESKSLLQKLKDIFGLSGSPAAESEPQTESGTDVTVEREPEDGDVQPETASEDAVKGTETATQADATTGESETTEFETTEDADESDTVDEAETVTESETDDDTDEATTEEAATESETAEGTDSEATEPVDAINGIGPTYAGRLSEIGIETVADLAAADVETVGDAAQTSDSRASDWIEQAQDF